jgi:hypothetical protein
MLASYPLTLQRESLEVLTHYAHGSWMISGRTILTYTERELHDE